MFPSIGSLPDDDVPSSFGPFVGWAVASLSATAVLVLAGEDSFARFLGDWPPLPVMVVVVIIGGACLWLLLARGWSQADPRWGVGRPLRSSVVAALVFATFAVSFDVVIPFRRDMNVAWPWSALYYPAIGFIAEIVFHVLPLALLALIGGRRFDTVGGGRRALIAIIIVATVETGFQVADSISTDATPATTVFVALHLFAIGLYELTAFRRVGFVALLEFRIGYYLLWHVVWGHIRLSLLF